MEPKHQFGNISLEKSVLTEFTQKMVPKYFQWLQDPDIQKDTCTEGLSLDEVAGLAEIWKKPGIYTFIICDKNRFVHESAEESMIGDLNLFVGDESVEVNLMIAEKEFRRLGIAQEVVKFVERWVRDVLGIMKVVAKIGGENFKSIGLFSKLGFVEYEKDEAFGEVHLMKDLTNNSN